MILSINLVIFKVQLFSVSKIAMKAVEIENFHLKIKFTSYLYDQVNERWENKI